MLQSAPVPAGVLNVHPLIRVLLFLLCAVLLPVNGAVGLAVGALLLVLFWGMARRPWDAGAWRALRRIRWLLLSLVVVYGWFTPGRYLIPDWGEFSPTWEGMLLGGERAALLVLLALGAHLLLSATPRESLVSALALLAPRDSRFPLRLVLTLEAVGTASERLQQAVTRGQGDRWQRLGGLLAQADTLPPPRVAPPAPLAWPAWRQWAWLAFSLPLWPGVWPS